MEQHLGLLELSPRRHPGEGGGDEEIGGNVLVQCSDHDDQVESLRRSSVRGGGRSVRLDWSILPDGQARSVRRRARREETRRLSLLRVSIRWQRRADELLATFELIEVTSVTMPTDVRRPSSLDEIAMTQEKFPADTYVMMHSLKNKIYRIPREIRPKLRTDEIEVDGCSI